MSRTTKPCPGCGGVYPHRGANEVCRSCKELIQEAKAARERIAAQEKGHEYRLLSDRSFDLPYIPHQPFDKSPSEVVQANILKLVNLMGEKASGESTYEIPVLITPLPGARSESTFHWDVWQLPKGSGAVFEKLYHGILGAVEAAYLHGIDRGEDFINRIARGEVSANDLSEHDEKLAQAKQRKKKK